MLSAYIKSYQYLTTNPIRRITANNIAVLITVQVRARRWTIARRCSLFYCAMSNLHYSPTGPMFPCMHILCNNDSPTRLYI